MKFRNSFGMVAAAILFVSCDTGEFPNDDPSANALKIECVAQNGFQPDRSSRASYEGYSTKFEEGDRLGLILIDQHGQQTANAPFTCRSGQWVNDNAQAYSSKTARIIAYYPYNANLAGSVTSAETLKETVEIKSDQSSPEDFKTADLLVCEIDQPAVGLNIVFGHAFSMLNLSAKATLTVDGETFAYTVGMADVALTIGDASYTPCNLNGTYVCLVKDGSLLETNKFRYFYTISGQTSVKTVKEEITTAAGTQYTFPCTGGGSETSVAIGDFYCMSEATGKAVIVPGNAAALPAGLTCSGVVFHVMDNAAFSAFAATNDLESTTLPGYNEKHGLVVSTKKGKAFGSAGAPPHADLTAVFSGVVADYQNLDVSNGYKMTQTLQKAIAEGTTTVTFTALDNHKENGTANATSWYAPSFNELKCLSRGGEAKEGSVTGLEQVNKQLSKLPGADRIEGNIPSITITTNPAQGGLCLMENGVEMGWHGIPGESFCIICAF